MSANAEHQVVELMELFLPAMKTGPSAHAIPLRSSHSDVSADLSLPVSLSLRLHARVAQDRHK